MTMQQEARYDDAAQELEQELSDGFITNKQFNQYMKELDEDFSEQVEDNFAELFEGWGG